MRAMACFDVLPDAVVCLIFSKLEDAQTVALCSTVCRRWGVLCRNVDTLTFESFKLFEKRVDRNRKASFIEAIVSDMLSSASSVRNLKISYHPVVWPWLSNDFFSESRVCQWLKHVSGSLERLTLVDPNLTRTQPQRLIHLSECKKLQWLNLCYGSIPKIPSRCQPLCRLNTCLLDLIVISDNALAAFVDLCPLLEVLKLNSCKGLRYPQLNAPSLTCLDFVNELDVCVESIKRVSANAPKLLKVSLSYVEELVTEGQNLAELDLLCHVRPQMVSLPSLISLSINGHTWKLESISELVRLGTNVKFLYIDAIMEDRNPLQLDSFFNHLLELRTLYIGSDIFKCLQAGAKLMSLPQSLCLPRLEEITVIVIYGNEDCIAILGALLKCSASLMTLRINAELLENSTENVMFFTHVLALQRSYPFVEITLDCPDCLM
eukprot:c23591_g1_i1 orf=298-1599(+)